MLRGLGDDAASAFGHNELARILTSRLVERSLLRMGQDGAEAMNS
jgi:hypothetical protein